MNVHPRKADEELFPNPIDKELAKLELHIQSDFIVPSDAPNTIPLRDRCFDRLKPKCLVKLTTRTSVVNRTSPSPIEEVRSVHVTSFSIIAALLDVTVKLGD